MKLTEQYPTAKPFTLAGNSEVILMIHGFTSTPNVFRDLAHHLSSSLGWEIHVPLLPGHGTIHQDLNKVSAKQWMDFCGRQVIDLSKKFNKVHVMGLSMGGTLAAHLATKFPNQVSSITLFSPAMYLSNFGKRLLLSLVRFLPDSMLSTWILKKDLTPPYDEISYTHHSAKSVVEFNEVCRTVKDEFRTDKPCLIFVPKEDDTIDPKSSKWFFKHLHHSKSKMITLHNSPHVVFLGPENNIIFSETEKFLKSV